MDALRTPSDAELRVLMAPATRRDGEAAAQALAPLGVELVVAAGPDGISRQIAAGVGAIVLTELALAGPGLGRLEQALAAQPDWSDIPVVLALRSDASAAMTAIHARLSNVTVIDRPTSIRTLVSAIQAALRARRRQYEIRDRIEALERAEQALRDGDRRKDQFLATLAHELRNPLAPIRNAAHLLASPDLTPAQLAECAAMIARQSRSMAMLLNDLLDVARITNGKLELRFSEVSLQAIVDSAVESVGPLVKSRRHRLVTAVRHPAARVWADPLRLSQVLTNVLANAAKYTDPGGNIELAVDVVADVAEFVVRDDGVGIDGQLLPLLFEMFNQAADTLDRSQGGLGIGLALARSLIEMHGGEITASSDGKGRGAVFRMTLPVAGDGARRGEAAAPAPAAQGPATAAGAGVGAGAGARVRVLVADDNVDAASSVAMLLELDGYDVQMAHDGRQAIARAHAARPAAMVVDIGMPGADGYEVARSVRRSDWGEGVLLIATTGWGQPEDRQRALDAGFDAHLTKPVYPEHLRQALSCGLARHGRGDKRGDTPGVDPAPAHPGPATGN
jgi:signal transduction histidine kinase/ActR/RegA family two-component response regulator